MKLWQRILNGKGEIEASSEIKVEIQRLKSSGLKMENEQPGLEKTLEKARKELLAEDSEFDEVQKAEKAISENKSKLSAISDISKELETKLTEALSKEQARRQSGITGEVAVIDEQIAETRLEIVKHFAEAAALYENVTGQDPTRFGFDFIFNHDLTCAFGKRVSEIEADNPGSSLYLKRQALSAEADRLGRG